MCGLCQQPRRAAFGLYQFYSLFIERNEGVCTEPASFICDNTISKITALVSAVIFIACQPSLGL
jgi:hypothetical protein